MISNLNKYEFAEYVCFIYLFSDAMFSDAPSWHVCLVRLVSTFKKHMHFRQMMATHLTCLLLLVGMLRYVGPSFCLCTHDFVFRRCLTFNDLFIYLGNGGFNRRIKKRNQQDWGGETETHILHCNLVSPSFTCLFSSCSYFALAWIGQTQAWSTSHSWSSPVENMQIVENSTADHVAIPTDGASEWEIDIKLLNFGNKVASGSYGDLWVFTPGYHENLFWVFAQSRNWLVLLPVTGVHIVVKM